MVRIEELMVNESADEGSPRTLNVVALMLETDTVLGST